LALFLYASTSGDLKVSSNFSLSATIFPLIDVFEPNFTSGKKI